MVFVWFMYNVCAGVNVDLNYNLFNVKEGIFVYDK